MYVCSGSLQTFTDEELGLRSDICFFLKRAICYKFVYCVEVYLLKQIACEMRETSMSTRRTPVRFSVNPIFTYRTSGPQQKDDLAKYITRVTDYSR